MDIDIKLGSLIYYIEKTKGLGNEELVNVLTSIADLSDQERFFVYLYHFPRPLLDMELPPRIAEYRNRMAIPAGSLELDINELSILCEAYKSSQYHRFIMHLISAYTSPEVYPQEGEKMCECVVCKKGIYEAAIWKKKCDEYPRSIELDRREYLAYFSTRSKSSICLNCITQLLHLNNFLAKIEPDYRK